MLGARHPAVSPFPRGRVSYVSVGTCFSFRRSRSKKDRCSACTQCSLQSRIRWGRIHHSTPFPVAGVVSSPWLVAGRRQQPERNIPQGRRRRRSFRISLCRTLNDPARRVPAGSPHPADAASPSRAGAVTARPLALSPFGAVVWCSRDPGDGRRLPLSSSVSGTEESDTGTIGGILGTIASPWLHLREEQPSHRRPPFRPDGPSRGSGIVVRCTAAPMIRPAHRELRFRKRYREAPTSTSLKG